MTTLRVMTANLLVDRVDVDDLRAVVAEQAPDVICVQELRDAAAEVLAETHPFGRLDPRRDHDGMGIALRSPGSVETLDLPVRRGFVATIEPGDWQELDQPLQVVNIHLLNPLHRPWGAVRDARRGQIAGVRSHVEASQVPTVIVGDMNASPRWPEYRMLADFATDAAEAAGTQAATWAQFVRGPRWIRIDHVFVRDVAPVSTTVRRIQGSDHFALIADVEVGRSR